MTRSPPRQSRVSKACIPQRETCCGINRAHRRRLARHFPRDSIKQDGHLQRQKKIRRLHFSQTPTAKGSAAGLYIWPCTREWRALQSRYVEGSSTAFVRQIPPKEEGCCGRHSETFKGTALIHGGVIAAIDPGPCAPGDSVDFEGDYLLPGLIDLHTDDLERHMRPLPRRPLAIDLCTLLRAPRTWCSGAHTPGMSPLLSWQGSGWSMFSRPTMRLEPTCRCLPAGSYLGSAFA